MAEKAGEKEAARTIAAAGVNCWRRERAERVAFLIDTAVYFEALAGALARAERSVLIAGWDFDTRLRLRREAPDDFPPLGKLLSRAVIERPGLQVRILLWDFPIMFALDRELFPLSRFLPRSRGRLKVHFDSVHPVGASLHQKLVVIDDRLAFVGGVDLTARRWDTTAHLPRDPRRVDPTDVPYNPYHDVQMAVAGPVAAALGELFRDRWRRATGRDLVGPPTPTGDPWPPTLAPDLSGQTVAIARTDPLAAGGPVREVEELFLDTIAAADRYLYFENQYLTSARIGDALANRLHEPDGPEVVIVGPQKNHGWLEHQIMGNLRANLIKRLRAADRHDRFRVYYPEVRRGAPVSVFVHSKLMVADDRMVRIGSANLSNRSMGLDTECDLFLESEGDPQAERAIGGLRDRLLAEHLGAKPEEVRAAVAAEGSLIRGIERLNHREYTLAPVEEELTEWVNVMVSESRLFDPDEPMSADSMIENLLPEELKGWPHWRGLLAFIVISLLTMALSAALPFTPWGDAFSPEDLIDLAVGLRAPPWAPLAALGFFLAGGFLFLPESVLILVTAMVFGVVPGFLYSLLGTAANAAALFGLGRLLGRNLVRRLTGRRLNRISRKLARRDLFGIAALRVFPAGHYGLTNLVAGVSGVRWRDFLFGTILGMAPEALAVSVFGYLLARAVVHPGLINLLAAFGIAVGIFALLTFLNGYPARLRRGARRRFRLLGRRLGRRRRGRPGSETPAAKREG